MNVHVFWWNPNFCRIWSSIEMPIYDMLMEMITLFCRKICQALSCNKKLVIQYGNEISRCNVDALKLFSQIRDHFLQVKTLLLTTKSFHAILYIYQCLLKLVSQNHGNTLVRKWSIHEVGKSDQFECQNKHKSTYFVVQEILHNRKLCKSEWYSNHIVAISQSHSLFLWLSVETI